MAFLSRCLLLIGLHEEFLYILLVWTKNKESKRDIFDGSRGKEGVPNGKGGRDCVGMKAGGIAINPRYVSGESWPTA
jgi:hypothetical protein